MAVTILNAKELHAKINSGEPIFILDVRNTDEYEDWKIEGEYLESTNIPYFDFLEDDENNYKGLPKDKEIIVVCAKGGGSMMVAEILDERGYKVSHLEKGMVEWSQFYHPQTVAIDENMKLIQVNRLAKGCLSYMVISDGKALLVDPGRHIDEYIKLAAQENVTIETIMDTHCHADHISGAPELAEKTGAVYYIASGEMQDSEIPFEPLEKHEEVAVGSVNVKILAMPTPGHTPGSTSFLVNDKYLLSGDTVFVGGLGRPDLGGKAREWAQSLYETVMTKIANLSDEIVVLPSHFADVQEINASGFVGEMLGEIRNNNEILRTDNREQFTEMVVSGSEYATPPNYEQIIGINRGVVAVSTEQATELEIGPNRCAVHHSH